MRGTECCAGKPIGSTAISPRLPRVRLAARGCAMNHYSTTVSQADVADPNDRIAPTTQTEPPRGGREMVEFVPSSDVFSGPERAA